MATQPINTKVEPVDEFTEAMWQHMQKVNESCTQKIRALRTENAQLKQLVREHDGAMWELAERAEVMRNYALRLKRELQIARGAIEEPTL